MPKPGYASLNWNSIQKYIFDQLKGLENKAPRGIAREYRFPRRVTNIKHQSRDKPLWGWSKNVHFDFLRPLVTANRLLEQAFITLHFLRNPD